MVAIDNMRPQQVGLKRILESYIKHRREVIEKRSRFELQKAQKRQHIVDGLIKALSIDIPLFKTPITRPPTIAPITVPIPPEVEAPPKYTAAIASNSIDVPACGVPYSDVTGNAKPIIRLHGS